jgi:hypothetical protein
MSPSHGAPPRYRPGLRAGAGGQGARHRGRRRHQRRSWMLCPSFEIVCQLRRRLRFGRYGKGVHAGKTSVIVTQYARRADRRGRRYRASALLLNAVREYAARRKLPARRPLGEAKALYRLTPGFRCAGARPASSASAASGIGDRAAARAVRAARRLSHTPHPQVEGMDYDLPPDAEVSLAGAVDTLISVVPGTRCDAEGGHLRRVLRRRSGRTASSSISAAARTVDEEALAAGLRARHHSRRSGPGMSSPTSRTCRRRCSTCAQCHACCHTSARRRCTRAMPWPTSWSTICMSWFSRRVSPSPPSRRRSCEGLNPRCWVGSAGSSRQLRGPCAGPRGMRSPHCVAESAEHLRASCRRNAPSIPDATGRRRQRPFASFTDTASTVPVLGDVASTCQPRAWSRSIAWRCTRIDLDLAGRPNTPARHDASAFPIEDRLADADT